MVEVALNVNSIWTMPDTVQRQRYLVLLSDGGGNADCPNHFFPMPVPATGNCLVDSLVAVSAYLFDQRQVHCHVVGYPGGSAEQMMAVVQHGGAVVSGYVAAGNEASFAAAFDLLATHPEFCPPPETP